METVGAQSVDKWSESLRALEPEHLVLSEQPSLLLQAATLSPSCSNAQQFDHKVINTNAKTFVCSLFIMSPEEESI